MRKKIFIIHGKGVTNGLGQEGGGDLDTVGSNAFYTIWVKDLIKKNENRDAVYGQDYEFDFVNYQAGLSHLKKHKGCDLYLPDFPVDALSPRLKLLLLDDEEDARIRNKALQTYDQFKLNIYSYAEVIHPEMKTLYNSLINKVKLYLSEYSKYEVYLINELYSLFNSVIQLYLEKDKKNSSDADNVINTFMSCFMGINFKLIQTDICSLFDDNPINELNNKYIKEEGSLLRNINDLRKSFQSVSFKIRISDNLILLLTETAYLLRQIVVFLLKSNQMLQKPDQKQLLDYFNNLQNNIKVELNRILSLFSDVRIKSSTTKRSMNNITNNVKNCIKLFSIIKNIKQNKRNKIIVMLIEDENLIPVHNIDVTFKLIKGQVSFNRKTSGKEISIKTDKTGCCSLGLSGYTDKDYYIHITYDDLNYLKYTNIEDEEQIKQIEEELEDDSQQKNTGEILSESEEMSIEQGTPPSRALQVMLGLIEKDIRLLLKHDVQLIRIDDHHPWTKEIIDLLHKLKNEKLIKEDITMSGPPRGEEQEKSQQKCGTDLIYESLVQQKDNDNPGYKYLCHLAHVQDLHIKEDKLAIDLSKLIGSGYSKIEMVEKLSVVQSKKDLKKIMRMNNWDKVVKHYERSLIEVLPRVQNNMVQVTLLKKNGDEYNKGWGFYSLFKPFVPFFKDKNKIKKKFYSLNPSNNLKIYMALSPFTDRKAGEAKINVASAINYLKDKYSMDYFFFCYGSMLMTTRKVNPKKNGINLSTMVAHVGTKADGGHPEAATGKPSSNPGFPHQLFDRVNDVNFYEYAFYIAQKVSEFSDMELFDIHEKRINQYGVQIEKHLFELEKNLVYLNFQTKKNDSIKILLTKNVPGLNLSIAVNYLLFRKRYNMDYLLYAQGSEKLIIRNMNDDSTHIDVNKLVKVIGSSNDKGFLKAGIAFPKTNKDYPVKRLKFINAFSFIEYTYYLAGQIDKLENINFVNIEPEQSKSSSPAFKNKLLQMNNSLKHILVNYKGRNYKLTFVFSPLSKSFKRRDTFSVPNALSHILNTASSDIIFYTDGFELAVYKRNQCDFPLIELSVLLSRDKDIICDHYCKFLIKQIMGFDNYSDGFLGPLSFPLFVNYITQTINNKESIQIIKQDYQFPTVIPAVNEELLDRAFRNNVKVMFYNQQQKKRVLAVLLPYYNEKEIHLTYNEILAYIKAKNKNIQYVLLCQSKKKAVLININDRNQFIDISRIKSIGIRKKNFKEFGLFYPVEMRKFPKQEFDKINQINFSEYIGFLTESIAEELNVSVNIE